MTNTVRPSISWFMPRSTNCSVRVSMVEVALVQHQHGRVGDGGARYGEQLALTLRQVRAVLGQHGVVSVGQAADEAVGVGQLGRGAHLVVVLASSLP